MNRKQPYELNSYQFLLDGYTTVLNTLNQASKSASRSPAIKEFHKIHSKWLSRPLAVNYSLAADLSDENTWHNIRKSWNVFLTGYGAAKELYDYKTPPRLEITSQLTKYNTISTVISGLNSHHFSANNFVLGVLSSDSENQSSYEKYRWLDNEEEELKIYNELLKAQTQFKAVKNEVLGRFSSAINNYLEVYEETKNNIELKKATAVLYAFTIQLEKVADKYRKLVGNLKQYTLLLKRDIRQTFRKLIRFLFKNMDSESHSEKWFVQKFSNYFFKLINSESHDKSRIHCVL